MNQMRASHHLYDDPVLEETEFALAISPCPQIERPKDSKESSASLRTFSKSVPRRQAPTSSRKRFGGRDFTDALTIGWAIAFAVAVALAVHAAGF
ncbi:MAG: hypothetical protein JJE42_09980 [Burkholderiales bacterium]|nr:hypothetical protein [Burkholderiales bacterium]